MSIESCAYEIDSIISRSNLGINKEYPEVEGEELVLQFNMDTGVHKKFNNVSTSKFEVNNLKAAVPNYVFVTITPQASSYKITVTNLGVDTIDSVKLICKVYKNSGAYMKGITKTLKKVKPGNTKWTWKIEKGATVQETIKVSGTAQDGKDKVSFSGSTVRYNFVGGKYGTMKAYDGHKHHMPSKSVSPLSAYMGPAVRMVTKEHTKTASYGNTTAAKKFRAKEKEKIEEGKFLEAQRLGISDVQAKFGAKYNAAINSMVSYTRGLGYTR